MDFLLGVNLTCFLLSYLVALTAEVAQFVRCRTRTLQTVVFAAALAGLIAHTAYLIARFRSSGLPPLVGSSHDWLLVLAWLGVTLLLLLTFQTRSSQGIFLLPVVVLLVLLAISVDSGPANVERSGAGRWWTMLHAASLVIGISLVAGASGSALMYLLQYRKLHGRITWVRRLRLPNLERLTAINYWLVMACFPFLTAGLSTGFILTNATSDGNSTIWYDPIVWATVVVWVAMTYNLSLLVRTKAQTGRTVARRTLLAGAFLLVTIFGLTFVTGGIHNGDSLTEPPLTSDLQQAKLSSE
ncbi:MAG: cytochrome c biogenesis protein [Fuerstiella sp.]|nr:cytochrome c biogenesis protein [Fuerstiella sp.]